jgi:hypothetical protein
MREVKLMPAGEIGFPFPAWMKEVLSDSVLGLFLSVIPGLAHLVRGRFKEIRWYFLWWVILLLSGFFLYGSVWGLICLGASVGFHAGIALEYGLLKDLRGFSNKVIAAVTVAVVLALIYRVVFGMLLSNFVGGYIPLTIRDQGIESGDYLLASRGPFTSEQVGRGSLVLIRPGTIIGGRNRYVRRGRSGLTVGEIIGLPGEVVEVQDDAFRVNGERLTPERYPAPEWLRNSQISVDVGNDCYFVSSEYEMHAHGRQLTEEDIRKACVFRRSEIEGLAFMLWQPLGRRGFLR